MTTCRTDETVDYVVGQGVYRGIIIDAEDGNGTCLVVNCEACPPQLLQNGEEICVRGLEQWTGQRTHRYSPQDSLGVLSCPVSLPSGVCAMVAVNR